MMKPSETNILDRQICQTIRKSSQATELMELLSYEIGPRPPGSKAMSQAQELLSKRLSELGCDNVHTECVPVIAWRNGASKLELVQPRRQSIQSVQHVHSASGEVAAELLVEPDRVVEQLLQRRAHQTVVGGSARDYAVVFEQILRRAVLRLRLAEPL